MLSFYDYIVIAFFFVFMLSLGPIFKHFSKNDSDYFRGGGQMLWWMIGAAAFMSQFSAWTFTGAASKAYEDGTLVTIIFFSNALGFFFNFLWFAPWFRQMRLVTPIESVYERFGPVNEQVFTWLQIPMSLVYAALWLNGLAVFASAVFGLDLTVTMWVVGAVVLVMSVAGGAWAVVAGSFVQMLILMAISIVTPILVLMHPDIGGLSGFVEKVPSHYFHWTDTVRPQVVWFWVIASFLKQIFTLNNMQESARYLGVKDSRQARKAALLASVLMLVGPLIWFIPPMAAKIFAPDISSLFPTLKNGAEASYILAAHRVLPIGMMGLLVCGLFSATISSMDAGLNRNAGIFVRSFYQRVVKTESPTHLLIVGRLVSAVFGVLIILIANYISKLQTLDLFNVMLLFSGLIALPYAIPLVWGVLIKKTPAWSGWSTVLVGLTVSIVLKNFVDPAWFGEVCGFDSAMSPREVTDYYFFFGIIANLVICSAWFLFTRLFYKHTRAEYRERVETFFTKMHTPIDFHKEVGEGKDSAQSKTLGILCFIYGGFILLLMLIPNSSIGRISFVLCGGLIAGIGVALYTASRKKA
jgi:Na+/proline symporter